MPDQVLLQQKVKDGGGWSIRLGDKAIAYVESFRFFMTVKMFSRSCRYS